MQAEVDAWCERMLPYIRGLSEGAAERYSDGGRLPHYRAVARRLASLENVDAAVWQAGFLHGLLAPQLDELPEVGDEVRRLARARAALGSLTSPVDVLARLDPRAALVLVIEQLHHADPDGLLEAWATRFHLEPAHPPAAPSVGPRYLGWRAQSMETYRGFLRTVAAPVARHIGLWNEANVLEDAALYLEDSSRFNALAAFARDASAPGGACARRVAAVRAALGEEAEVRWEWRHISRLDTRLPRTPWDPTEHPNEARDWVANLIHCGFVTVVTPGPGDCWPLLGRLHAKVISHRDEGFRDFLARPTYHGYQALHTEVTVDLEGRGTATVAVRVLPNCADSRRFGPTSVAVLEGCEHRDGGAPAAVTEQIQVFAPDGRAVILAPGACVLNFAYRIHRHLPALLRGAQVNRQRVTVLQPLHEGDVVWLDVAKDPAPLPRGWERVVPPETVRPIRQGFKAVYRSALLERGRTVLREHLVASGAGAAPDDETLDGIVVAVSSALERQGHRRAQKKAAWWYHQLGINDAVERHELPPRRDRRGDELLSAFLARARQEVLLRKALHDLSHEGERPEARWCPRCSPGNQDQLVFQVKDGKLFVHRTDAECAIDTLPLSLHFPPPQYVTVLADDRPGMAGDVLRVLYEQRLGIRRIDAVRREQGMGVIRVKLDPTPEARIESTVAELRRMAGIRLVAGLGDKAPFEERILPPREKVAFRATVTSPYVVGPPARGQAFYGMGSLIEELEEALERVRGRTAPSGGHVLLKGSKRTGKTSTVLEFLEKLQGRAVTAYVEAGKGDDWRKCEGRMMDRLRHAAAVAGVTDSLTSTSLYDLAVEVRDRTHVPVVMAFDEAMYMTAATRAAGLMPELCRFASQTRATPGLLALWIGPTGDRQLVTELDETLQSATSAKAQDLAYEDAAALLSAQQSDQCGRIEVADSVARRIYQLTLGNPYWLNAFGLSLYERCEPGGDRVRRYEPSVMADAEFRVLNDERLFVDRYRQEDPLGTTARIWELTLNYLAYPGGSPKRVEKEAVLLEKVNERLPKRIVPADWNDILDEMEARGAIKRDRQSACFIHYPLLAAHIHTLAHPSRRGDRWLR